MNLTKLLSAGGFLKKAKTHKEGAAQISKKNASTTNFENAKSLKSQKRDARQRAKLQSEKLKRLDQSIDAQNEELKKQLKKEAPPKTAQQTIKYKRMFEDGICDIGRGLYSKMLRISDINYQNAHREEQVDIFSRYCEILNYCDPSMYMQISVLNRRIDSEEFQSSMFYRLRGDNLDTYRKLFNQILSSKALEGDNSILREKYITFSTFAPSYNIATSSLARIEDDIVSLFKGMGCDVSILSGYERLKILHGMLRPGERFSWTYDNLLESSQTTKDAIAPMSFNFHDSKSQYQFGDYVGQTLYLRDLPADMTDGLVSDLSDLPIDMTITIHVTNVAQDKALTEVRQKISFMEQQKIDEQKKLIRQQADTELIPHELKRSLDEAEDLLDDLLNKNQRMFKVTLLINTYAADIDTLDDNVIQIAAAVRKKACGIANLDYLQEDAMNSILPLGKNFLEIQRTLTTASTAIFVPFTTQEVFQPGGLCYGQNAISNNLVVLDRKGLKAPNGMILGTPGSGKSMAAKWEIQNILCSDPNSEVLIIDPEAEYAPIAKGFGGELIHISAGSRNFINPLDITMDYADNDDPLLLKSEFVLSLCSLLIGGRGGLHAAHKSIISRCCELTYRPFFANSRKYPVPTLKDFFNVLRIQPEREAHEIALALEVYIRGALSVFSNPTNVDADNRLVVYDICALGKELRTMGMLVVLDQIWNRITRNRAIGKRTWIYIDEIQLLFQNEYSATYFFELWSRARKWGAIPTGITQNVETLLLSDLARRMLSNSDFVLMFNQATSDRVELASLLNISARQLLYVTNSEAGHGLLCAGNSIVPIVNKIPKNMIYEMMTTKIDEVVQREQAAKLNVVKPTKLLLDRNALKNKEYVVR